jgi:hypothetical protein
MVAEGSMRRRSADRMARPTQRGFIVVPFGERCRTETTHWLAASDNALECCGGRVRPEYLLVLTVSGCRLLASQIPASFALAARAAALPL